MKRNIASFGNMDFRVFSGSTYIDEIDGSWFFLEKCGEFFWSYDEHGLRKNG
jgi:hypothetical protein